METGEEIIYQVQPKRLAMTKIQVELVREAIFTVCFCLIKKQRKGEETKRRLQSREGQLHFQLPSGQKKISTRAIYCTSPVSKKSLVITQTPVTTETFL